MGLFKIFSGRSKKETQELKPVKTERMGVGFRIAKMGMKKYTVSAAIMYNGNPQGKVEFTVKARSRDNAAHIVQSKTAIKVVSSKPIK